MKRFAGLLTAAFVLSGQAPRDEFQQKLYPVLEGAQCRSCHNDNGVASATRLRQVELDAAVREAEIELEFVSGWELP